MFIHQIWCSIYCIQHRVVQESEREREGQRERMYTYTPYVTAMVCLLVVDFDHICKRTHSMLILIKWLNRTHSMRTYTPYVTAKVSLLVVDFDERHPRLYHRPWIHLFVHVLHTHTHTTHTQTHTHTHTHVYIYRKWIHLARRQRRSALLRWGRAHILYICKENKF
jgi:hypothetical protein